MHGTLNSALCMSCGARLEWPDDMDEDSVCPVCSEAGYMRPDVVWFGETPYDLPVIEDAVSQADIFVAIGTSGVVHPAAGLVLLARSHGARRYELNLKRSPAGPDVFNECVEGEAIHTVPAFVDRLLGRAEL